ncbi:fimbrial protein [Yersinia entomophaga]|uniref:Fimbrial protein n=1 Tax=Yersinia entomophaga TaxID=935293 RepID=A0ABN4PU95_YERET|nr:fimbria/pilus periplasmic chaperone [Yersinia entomophaga]ANI30579.1 fimbrial protein [Yersinia entomophaga]OWF87954.1 fimbrial protein [Yersinia entomophaga]
MKKIQLMALLTCLMVVGYKANAAIVLDRTRVIYTADVGFVNLSIRNENKTLPYLAQSWIENVAPQSTSVPLAVSPEIQRVNSGEKNIVRIYATLDAKTLPQDRESLFYYTLREIPPRSDIPDAIQVALQTKIKLFYRPLSIVPQPDEIWQQRVILHKTAQGYRLENPTPYYLTVIGLAARSGAAAKEDFPAIMVAPMSSSELVAENYPSPVITYINDYGAHPELSFSCHGAICRAIISGS